MYQKPVVLFIGLRYILKYFVDQWFRFISCFSIIAIVFGVIAMVVIFSIMNGFEYNLQNNILGLIPHAIVSSKTGSLNPQKFPEKIIKLRGIKYITPITVGDVILQSANNLALGVILGIDPIKKDPLTPYIIDIKQNDLKPGKYNAILGEQLANKLVVKRGDQLRIITSTNSQFTPIGHFPNQRLFNVIGIFSSKNEVDNYQILVNIHDASRLMHYPIGNITGWRLWLNEPLRIDKLIFQNLPKNIVWKDWRERKGELFHAVQMEKNVMKTLSSLIIIIASFNIITSLGVIIIEKKSEIAILKTYGLLSNQVMMIFIVQGSSIGMIGASLGAILGIIFTNHLNKILFVIGVLPNNILLPTLIKPVQVITIISLTIMISFLSTLYPSWYAANNKPAETLRYE